MREMIEIEVEGIRPDHAAVLTRLGWPPRTDANAGVIELLDRALHLFSIHADPRAVYSEVSPDRFAEVYEGVGENEPRTPLADLYPKADHLALFAATMGEEVGAEIVRRFNSREFAIAAALDGAVSEATDRAGDVVQRRYLDRLAGDACLRGETAVVRHSPGRCGWHVSGQGDLVRELHPDEIGITLVQSFLMEPLKSMSGVLVAGPPEIHSFEPNYPTCLFCERRDCRERARTAPRAGGALGPEEQEPGS